MDLKDLPKLMGSGDPVKGLNEVVDWSNTLSLGEQQRLAFSRILVSEPKLVILDEATSALDLKTEERLYGVIERFEVVSVGHRPSLVKYHDLRLRLGGFGGEKMEVGVETISKKEKRRAEAQDVV